jgi:hypothetical protein
VASGAWARSGRRPGPPAGGRPAGSFAVALGRARGVWDELTGGPDAGEVYSVAAAAAIVGLALGLWADTARSMGPEEDGQDGRS